MSTCADEGVDNEKNLITIHRQYVGAVISIHSIRVLGSNLQGDRGLFVGSLRVLPMACMRSSCTIWFPPTAVQIRSTG